MSASPSMPPKAVREAEIETAELDLDGPDSPFRATPPAPSSSDETFEEELLRDAYLPKDGGPSG